MTINDKQMNIYELTRIANEHQTKIKEKNKAILKLKEKHRRELHNKKTVIEE